jgi:hypothetical protein
MKYCPNYRCVGYGRVVYSQATRCAFCRWDLKPPRMKSEVSEPNQQAYANNTDASSRNRSHLDVPASSNALRRTA